VSYYITVSIIYWKKHEYRRPRYDYKPKRLTNKYTFTSDQKLQLISLYRSKEILWNIKRADYHDKSAKELAYSDIASRMNVAIDDVKHQVNNLRSQFNAAHRQVTEHKPTGTGSDGKKPKRWWVYDELLFLADTLECRETPTNVS
jgi:Alcohol dehydrogenase transcription factor Myb/SANT-like